MDAQKVDMFMVANAKNFRPELVPQIRERLLTLEDSQWSTLLSIPFKETLTSQVVSFMGGTLGIDRFLVGDVGLGIAKLLTCGGFGIWTIVDWFLITDAARDKNAEMLANALHYVAPSTSGQQGYGSNYAK